MEFMPFLKLHTLDDNRCVNTAVLNMLETVALQAVELLFAGSADQVFTFVPLRYVNCVYFYLLYWLWRETVTVSFTSDKKLNLSLVQKNYLSSQQLTGITRLVRNWRSYA